MKAENFPWGSITDRVNPSKSRPIASRSMRFGVADPIGALAGLLPLAVGATLHQDLGRARAREAWTA
jgi:hypothetical protein